MERGRRKMLTGRVISDKMEKTRIISIERITKHPLYGKIVRRTKRYKYHDENNQSHTGDLVKIMETRPLSKDKRWRLVEVIEKSKL